MIYPWKRVRKLLVVAITALAVLSVAPAASAGEASEAVAEFEGQSINLAEDWGDASACHIGDGVAVCFRTEAEMDAWLAPRSEARLLGPIVMASSCSSTLRLYANTGWSGSTLSLSTRGQWLNLSSYGFDQKTSSYKIGACNSLFADLAGGGGGRMSSGLTSAYAQYPSMPSGWDNDVSSVYIY